MRKVLVVFFGLMVFSLTGAHAVTSLLSCMSNGVCMAYKEICQETECRPKTCSAGYYLSANNVCVTCTANYVCPGGTYNPTSTIQGRTACSTAANSYYTKSDAGSSAASDCYLTTTAGKYVSSANGAATTACTANYYCPSGTKINYGNTGGRTSCSVATSSKYRYSAASSDEIGDCYLTTTAGNYVAEAGAGQVECAEDGYCAGSTKIYYGNTGGRTLCTKVGSGFYPNSAAGSSAATDCKTDSISGAFVASANATSATTCKVGTYKGSHQVNYGSTSSCSSCSSLASGAYPNTEGTGSTASSQCYASCGAGTGVFEYQGACTTPSQSTLGSGWYMPAHTVFYGRVSPLNVCQTGFNNPSDTAANHASAATCQKTVSGQRFRDYKSSITGIRFSYGGYATTLTATSPSVTTTLPLSEFHVLSSAGTAIAPADSAVYGVNSSGTVGDYVGSSSVLVDANHSSGANFAAPGVALQYDSVSAYGIMFAPYAIRAKFFDIEIFVLQGGTWVSVATINELIVVRGIPVTIYLGETYDCAKGSSKGSKTYDLADSATGCTSCPNWSYAESTGMSSCTSCPTLTSGWSKSDSSGTGWTSYSSCKQIIAATDKSSNCYGGNFMQTAASATTWGSTTRNTATADKGYYVNTGSTTCSACAAGYYNATDGYTGTASTCEGTIAAGYYGAAGATSSTGSGAVSGGYYSTGGGTSATPTAAGNGCISSKSCGKLGAAYFSSGGGTTSTGACISGKTCGSCPTATSGWTADTTTGKDAVTDCYQTIAATDKSSNCYGGSFKQNATSTTAWGSTTRNTATADKGYYVNTGSTTCSACAAGYYNATDGYTGTANTCEGTIAAGYYGGAGATSSSGTGKVTAGYYSTGGGTSATPTEAGNGCISSKACGPIAAGYYGAAGATVSTGSGAVSGGYYSTGGGTSATPTAAGDGCISSKACGQITAGYYCGGGGEVASPSGTSDSATGKACGKCPTPQTGWSVASSTGKTALTECREARAATTADSTECNSGYFWRHANADGSWGSTVAGSATAKAGKYLDLTNTVCAPCTNGRYSEAGKAYTAATCQGACTNKPDNSAYTSNGSTATNCSWSCNSGYGQNYANNCIALCSAGFGTLRTSTGVSVPLYATAVTTPAIHIKAANGTMCYGNLQSGSATGAINVKHSGTTYHSVQ